MAKLQNITSNTNLSVNKNVALGNIEPDNYELSRVRDYITDAIQDVSKEIRNLKLNQVVLSLSKDVSLSAGDNVPYDYIVSDPYHVYRGGVTSDLQGIVTIPVSGPVQISGTFDADGGGNGRALYLEINNEAYCKVGIFRGSEAAFTFIVEYNATSGDNVKITVDGNLSLTAASGLGSNQLWIKW